MVLPGGRWYDFHTGEYVGDGEVIEVAAALETIPIFVRDGGVVPMLAEDRLQVPGPGERVPFEVRHFGEAPGRFRLYDDDGATFDYEPGRLPWTEMSAERGRGGRFRGKVIRAVPGLPFGCSTVVWKMMSAPTAVLGALTAVGVRACRRAARR